MSLIREANVAGVSTDVFGRVLCSARNHHVVIDGPVPNGCPGEAITPPEAFLMSVAACGVELVQVIAREDNIRLDNVRCEIYGKVDRGNPVRPDFTLFNEVRVAFSMTGPTTEQAGALAEKFQKR
jgi:uncharacterized OsmC-like protein